MTPVELSSSGGPASWPVCSLASVYRTEPCPRCGPARRSASCSLRQRLVGDPLTDSRMHKTIEPFHRVPLHVSIVEAKRELVDVAAQVLAAGVMVDAMHTTLEQRPHAFDAVGAHVAAHVFAAAVVNRLMAEEQAIKAVVGRRLVSVERRADRHTRLFCRVVLVLFFFILLFRVTSY